MPKLKKIHLGFDLNIKDLMTFISEHNTGFDIQVYETKPKEHKPKELTGPKMLALPAPKDGKRPGLQAIIVAFLVAHPEGVTAAGLRALLVQSGYSEKSLNNQVYFLNQRGLVAVTGRGKYRATAKAKKLVEQAHG